MEHKHPHADAAYRVVTQTDQTFGVVVTIPGTYPTTVTGFATSAAAEAWVAGHKQQVVNYASKSFRRNLWARRS